tara:strand:- start:390 stop:926 length:537 start_codon:yes stop_codon:yes gene_type:complete
MTAKRELWILLAMFILPIALGTLFYFLNPKYFSENTVNYGELVQPIIATEKEDLIIDGNGSFEGIWTLAYVANSCGSPCNRAVKDMGTIRTLMNDEMRRIQTAVIIADGSKPAAVNGKVVSAVIASQTISQRLRVYSERAIFLIDPIGNIMMYYQPEGVDIKRVVKDLKRLLKYSRIG